MAASTCGVLLTSRQIIRCMLNFDKPLVMLLFFKSGFGIALFASTEDFGGIFDIYYLHFLPGVLIQ